MPTQAVVEGAAKTNLPSLPDRIVPRPELMEQLRMALINRPILALASSGEATGKTTACVQYGHANASAYPGGRFIISCASGRIESGLAALAGAFGISPLFTHDKRVLRIQDGLLTGPRALFILDDVPDEQWWGGCDFGAAAGSPLHILICTSSAAFESEPAIVVPAFSETQAISLLSRCRGDASDPASREAVSSLIELARDQPFALVAAGVVQMRAVGQSWSSLLSQLQSASDPMDALMGAPEQVLTSDERDILNDASMLPRDGIVRRWLVEMMLLRKGLRPAPGMASEPAEAQAIDVLLDMGLLRHMDSGGRLLGLPRPFRNWRIRLIESLPALEKTLGNALLALLRSRHRLLKQSKQHPFLQDELTALCAVVPHVAALGAPLSALDLANALAGPLQLLHRYDESADNFYPLIGDAGPLADQPPSMRHVEGLSALSFVERQRHHIIEAAALLQRASQIATQIRGEQSQAFGWILHHQSLLLADDKRFAEAEALMWQAMAIRRKFVSPDDRTFWAHHTILGMILQKQGKFQAAIEQQRMALGISKAAGESDERIAADLSLLAIYLKDAGDLASAKDASAECIRLSEEIYPAHHRMLATRYGNYSTILDKMRLWDEAILWLKRAIEVRLKHGPAPDPELATEYNNLALIYKKRGEISKALPEIHKAIAIYKRSPTASNRSLAISYHNLSTMHQALGDIIQALHWNAEAGNLAVSLAVTDSARIKIEKLRANLNASMARLHAGRSTK